MKQNLSKEQKLKQKIHELKNELKKKKKIEKILIEKEEQFRILTEQSNVGIFITQNEKIVFANQGLAKILEFTLFEINSWKIHQYNQHIYPNDLIFLKLNSILDYKNIEYRILTKSQKIKWVRHISQIIHFHGKIANQITVFDITDQKRVLKNLRKSEEKYRNLIENMTDFIFKMDLEGNFIFTNHLFPKHMGYEYTDFIKFNSKDLLHPDDVKKIESIQNEVIKGNLIKNIVFRYFSKDKKMFYLQAHASPLRNNEGKVIGILGVARDISEQRITEEKIRQSEAKFRLIVELSPFPILIINSDDSVNYLNSRFFEMFGFKKEDLSNWKEIFHFLQTDPSIIEKMLKMWQNEKEYLKSHATHQLRIDLKPKNNMKRKIQLRFVNMHNGQILIVWEDLTEQLRTEDARLRVQKIESLALLAGGIAHDFNNIMVGILGNINLLQLEENLTLDCIEALDDMEKSVVRARDLTNQLLTFSKGGEPIKRVQSIIPILEDSISLTLRGSISKYELVLEDELYLVNVDRGQINQVFNNLIINALQAMPNGGKVTISALNCQITSNNIDNFPILIDNGDYLQIIIKDTGIGIQKENQSHIFEPYFTTKPKGSGLGLATCYSIIKRHSGYIYFKSYEAQGTKFIILLPKSSHSEEIYSIQPTTSSFFQGNILILDDEPMVRKILAKMLNKLGLQTHCVDTGEKMIEEYQNKLLTSQKYDLVIMDLTIPGAMGGKETIIQLQRITPDIKAIVISGYSNDPIIANYTNYGFLGYLIKPFTIIQVRNVLEKIFQNK